MEKKNWPDTPSAAISQFRGMWITWPLGGFVRFPRPLLTCLFVLFVCGHMFLFFSQVASSLSIELQCWMWLPARRPCSRAWHSEVCPNERSMAAPATSSHRKLALWPRVNGLRGGTSTSSSPTWSSWCDWILAKPAVVKRHLSLAILVTQLMGGARWQVMESRLPSSSASVITGRIWVSTPSATDLLDSSKKAVHFSFRAIRRCLELSSVSTWKDRRAIRCPSARLSSTRIR